MGSFIAWKQWKKIELEFRCDMTETIPLLCCTIENSIYTRRCIVALGNQYKMTKKGRKFATVPINVCFRRGMLHIFGVVKTNEQLPQIG